MIEKRSHQVWFGEPMPEEFQRYREKLIRLHPTWEHMLWNEATVGGLGGLNLKALTSRLKNWAAVSNYVRLYVLDLYGGCYLDSDVDVIKPLDPLLKHSAFAAFQDDIDGGRLCNAVMGATAGHKWIEWQIQNANTILTPDAATGVYLATKAPRDRLTILPTEYFYPFHYDDPPEKRVPKPESYCCHWWQGSWTKK